MAEAGILLVDKPAGPTSHDLVAQVRHGYRGERVGHAGTLDPFATGLLIILVGRLATREQSRFMDLPKNYRTVARLGATSTTGDRDGEITHTEKRPDEPLVLPTGEIIQVPPVFSAIKVGGERAYRRARRGEVVKMPPRQVSVERFDLTERDGDLCTFEIECSSGTYVRSLIADLGDAYCEELRRTSIGPFLVDDADPERLIPIDAAVVLAGAFGAGTGR